MKSHIATLPYVHEFLPSISTESHIFTIEKDIGLEKAVLLAEQWSVFRCVCSFSSRWPLMVTFTVTTIISRTLNELCSGLEFLRSKDGRGTCFTLLVVTLAPWMKVSTSAQRKPRIPKIPSTPMTPLVACMSCCEVQSKEKSAATLPP